MTWRLMLALLVSALHLTGCRAEAHEQLQVFPTSSGTVPWTQVLHIDFASLPTTDYDHTAANPVIGGVTWSQYNGSTYADDLDVTAGTGLVLDASATSATFDIDGDTNWRLCVDIDDLDADFDERDAVYARVRLGALGDGNTELHGLYLGVDVDVYSMGGAVGIGHYTSQPRVLSYRQMGASVTPNASSPVATSVDTVSVVSLGGLSSTAYGTGGSAMPTGYTQYYWQGGNYSTSTISDYITAAMSLCLWAESGNTSNNFAPAFEELEVFVSRTSGVP